MRRLSMDEVIATTRKRGITCLSKEYKNRRTKMWWQCSHGHVWEAVFGSLRNAGSGCPLCYEENRSKKARKHTITDAQQLAESRGGMCLSEVYINNREPMVWKCEHGHVWEASFNRIKDSRNWCPECYNTRRGSTQRLSIHDMKDLARTMRGVCLSQKYINDSTPIRWRCENDHVWSARPTHIKRGHWCPYCRGESRGEGIVRELLEDVTERSFPRRGTNWLMNVGGNKLIFDGYCEELEIAFEFNGRQHYEEVDYFTRSRSFEQQVRDDQTKKRLCEEMGVKLIVIPHWMNEEEIRTCVYEQLESLNISV